MAKQDKKKKFGSVTIRESFKFAFSGLRYAFKNERNFFVHTIVALIVIILGELLNISSKEWIIIVIVISLVLAFELINTALESLVNLVTKEYNELAKVVKDCSAASVMIVAFMAIIIGLIIFIPKFVVLF